MRNEMEEGVADQCADAHAKHRVNNVVVCCRATELNNQQTTQRDDADEKNCNGPVAVHCNVHTCPHVHTVMPVTILTYTIAQLRLCV